MIFRLKTFLTPFFFLSAFCVFLPHASLGSEAKGPGGTVFGIHVLPAGYKLPDNLHDWDPISGSVNNYHVPQVRAQVNAEIQQLYQTGQRRSRLFLWHRRDALAPEDAPNRVIGTVLKSLGGDFSPQVMANLQDILKTMHATGFQEIEIVFGAVGQNYPFWWYDRVTAGHRYRYRTTTMRMVYTTVFSRSHRVVRRMFTRAILLPPTRFHFPATNYGGVRPLNGPQGPTAMKIIIRKIGT